MQTNFTPNLEQAHAIEVIYAAASEVLFRPFDPESKPLGKVIALKGEGGTGKTEILVQVLRRLSTDYKVHQAQRQARAQATRPSTPPPSAFTSEAKAYAQRPARKTAAELRREAKATKEATEFDELSEFNVQFTDEDEQA
jgi:hypothetical protein